MRFIIKVESDELQRRLEKAPIRVKKVLADGLDHATRSFMKTFFKERLQGPPGIKHNPRGIFHRFRRAVIVKGKAVFLTQTASSDSTIKSIANSAKDPMNMTVEIYSKSRVAGIHERGGSINTGKPMPIPLSEAAKSLLRNRISLQELSPIHINGKLFLARTKGREKPELLFILKRGIRIRPRLGFYQTWAEHQTRRGEIMDKAMDKAFNKLI